MMGTVIILLIYIIERLFSSQEVLESLASKGKIAEVAATRQLSA